MTSSAAPTHFVLRGWHVLAAMLAFFAAIIAVNVAFAVVAVRSFPGEDVRRSYLQGLNYNDTIAARRAQAALGWQANAVVRAGREGVYLEVDLRDRAGAPVNGATLAGELRWPTDARLDRALTFEASGAGRYVARLGVLGEGRWRLRAHAADAAGGALDFEAELQWRASH
jgi:nitrogen fixation protein FixH